MALFKPEVRDVGGTNLSAYTPPSMDYSGVIASIPAIFGMDQKSSKGPTEGEIEREALADVSSSLSRVMSIEDPTRKAVEFKKVRLNAIQSYPKYTDQINKVFAEFSGEVYQATGEDIMDIQQKNTLKWASETTEGKAAVSYAFLASGGDQAEAENIVTQQYMMSTQKELQMQKEKLASEKLAGDAAAKKAEFSVRARPVIQNDISNKFKMDTSPEVMQGIADLALKQGLDPAVVMLDALKAARAERLSEVTTDINRFGLDPKSENPDTFLAEYDSRIASLETNLDVFSRSFKNKNAQQIAQVANKIDNPIIAKGMISGDAAVTSYVLEADVNAKADLVNAIQTSTSFASGDMTAQTPQSVLSNGTVTDSPSAFAEQYKDVAPYEELVKLFGAKPAWTSSIKIAKDLSTRYNLDNETPEITEATHRALSTMYLVSLPEIDRNLEAIKPANVKTLMGDRMFAIADSMVKTNPLKGRDLYNKMNTYSANAAKNILTTFYANMDILRETDQVPFKLNMDTNGNITLQVNEVAARTDSRLKKAMGSYRYETKSAGRGTIRMAVEQLPTETDPIKILSNYVVLGQGSNQRELLDSIEALRVLAMQAKKIPVDVRSRGADTLEVIRQGIQ